MEASRRGFLGHVVRGGLAGTAALAAFGDDGIERVLEASQAVGSRTPEDVAQDEAYWREIQGAFTLDRTIINLNNGGVCPSPRVVHEAFKRYLDITNQSPVYHMWQILEPNIESVRRQLAHEFGCDPEELAITRNASESLQIAQLGIDLKPGDEVLTTDQDYPRMLTTWEQRVRRDGIKLTKIHFPVPPPTQQYLADMFEQAVTPRTKVILLCQITNLTGQIFPTREICRMARARGIKTIVDGAHAFAHFPFTRDELDCDYYATSLHKWMHAPIGAGFLYVRKAKIARLWPLMGSDASRVENIRKYEEIGTHPQANFNAVSVAINFHRGIGAERKIARLRYLRDRWAKALLAESPRVKVLTELGPDKAGAIAMFDVDGLDPVQLGTWMLSHHRIVNTPIVHQEFKGIRITPSVYTSVDEIDTFVDTVKLAIKKGIAA
jgi:isopenicillin-N epimerase